MIVMLGTLATVLLLTISAIHFYWALGGRKWAEVVLPQRDQTHKPVFTTGHWVTALAATIFLTFAGVIFLKTFPGFSRIPPHWIDIGAWIIAGLFLARALGDFKYVGYTKTVRSTVFAAYDTRFYMPLSLTIGLMIVVVALF